jgi:hypothetical protein
MLEEASQLNIYAKLNTIIKDIKNKIEIKRRGKLYK